jgi:hypothetical protein
MAQQAADRPRLAWPRPRFTIRALLWTTTIIASIFPATWFAWFLLLNASTTWGTHAMLAAALLLALTTAVAISGSGAKRAFWSGFATVGCAYFLLVVCDLATGGMRSYLFDRENLITTRLNQSVYREYVFPAMVAKNGNMFSLGAGRPSQEDFDQVAHVLWALLVAALGGLASLVIWAIGQRRSPRGADDERS